MVDVYDIVIFLPLWLELQVKAYATGPDKSAPAQGPSLPVPGPKLKELP
jgi:hypothetical protein